MVDAPAYLRIAADLRSRITAGDLAPGARLPSESTLMGDYGVSRTVAKWAVAVLKSDGLVEGRAGSGVFVRTVRRAARASPDRNSRGVAGSSSPFERDHARAGQRASWRHVSSRDRADLDTARRLNLRPGDPVMVTRYVFLADDEPIQLSRSWEPLALTRGTAVEWPEDGPVTGVVARMDRIGIRIDEVLERVIGRAAEPDEIEQLRLPARGAHVLVVTRTYLAGGVPVETADLVFLSDRYELTYRMPVD